MKNLFALLIAVSPALAQAGTVSTSEFLGFSADGSAVGFQQYGVTDGQGSAYCKVILVDTKKNTYIVPPSYQYNQTEVESPYDTGRSACAAAQAKIKTTLDKLNLDAHLGTHTFSRQLTDQVGTPATSVTFSNIPVYPAIPANDMTAKIVEGDGGLLTVSLVVPSGQELIMQKDSKVPKSRAGAMHYEFDEGYSLQVGNTWVEALSVRYYLNDFEGPSVKTIVVTAVVPTTPQP